MTQHNLTQILKVIRDLVMRNRPCYRDYLGTETVSTQICHGTVPDEVPVQADITCDDTSLEMLTPGVTYQVTINDETADYVARYIGEEAPFVGTAEFDDSGNVIGWCVMVYKGAAVLAVFDDSLPAGATISVSQSKTVKRYNTRLLPEYLLPAFLRKNVVATKTEVQSAAAKAAAAQTTANAAQTTANAAQTTANAAQSTADAALPKTGGELSGAISVTGGVDTAKLYPSAFYMTYIPTGGTQVSDRVYIAYDQITLGPTALSTPGISLNRNKGSSVPANIRISHSTGTVQINSDGEISSSKRLVLSCQNELEIQSVGATPTATGLVLHSSTTGSNKRFRITVDDTGTLTATEVTS